MFLPGEAGEVPRRGVCTGDITHTCAETSPTLSLFSSRSISDVLLLLWDLWGCGHRSCDVHKSTGFRAADFKVELCDALGAVVDVEQPILGRRAQRQRLFAECLSDLELPVPEADHAAVIDLADDVARAVGDRRQGLAEQAWAGAVTVDRRPVAERLVRTLAIVDLAPSVERP